MISSASPWTGKAYTVSRIRGGKPRRSPPRPAQVPAVHEDPGGAQGLLQIEGRRALPQAQPVGGRAVQVPIRVEGGQIGVFPAQTAYRGGTFPSEIGGGQQRRGTAPSRPPDSAPRPPDYGNTILRNLRFSRILIIKTGEKPQPQRHGQRCGQQHRARACGLPGAPGLFITSPHFKGGSRMDQWKKGIVFALSAAPCSPSACRPPGGRRRRRRRTLPPSAAAPVPTESAPGGSPEGTGWQEAATLEELEALLFGGMMRGGGQIRVTGEVLIPAGELFRIWPTLPDGTPWWWIWAYIR